MSNGPALFAVTLPSPSTAPAARWRSAPGRDDDTTTRRNLCESLRRILPVGVAALRAVNGARIGKITSGLSDDLTACDFADPDSVHRRPDRAGVGANGESR